MRCGLLGRRLGHSYSPAIHKLLGDHSYELFEVEPEDLEQFLRQNDFRGLNVTMPYKKAVIPYLDELSPQAQALGAVNTIVGRADGSLWGHNTDYFGFSYLLKASGMNVHNKPVLVLGSGGACATAVAVLQEAGAKVTVISRSGPNNYENIENFRDAAVIINTTPVGMYPHNGESPVDLALFPQLEGVLDVIYNPARTQLMLQAQKRGIPAFGGLRMLVAQAWEASQCFTGAKIAEAEIQRIYGILRRQMQNIILIGMPGCGKTTVGKALAQSLGRAFIDVDACIEETAAMTISDIFRIYGEPHFRQLEADALAQVSKGSGLVIATGGGAVTREENYDSLHQNGVIFYLQRPVEQLATQGRPLSQGADLHKMLACRHPLYLRFADHCIENKSLDETVSSICRLWEEL